MKRLSSVLYWRNTPPAILKLLSDKPNEVRRLRNFLFVSMTLRGTRRSESAD